MPEPAVGAERVVALDSLLAELTPRRAQADSPSILAIDGRSAAGKTTLAARIARRRPGTSVVHSDDIAWHHSRFGWTDLLIDHVLSHLRRREPVRFRPPGWEPHGRAGWLEVPSSCRLLVVEGVGVGRAEMRSWLDGLIWVETAVGVAEERDLARIRAGTGAGSEADMRGWLSEEDPFLMHERPWVLADPIVAGASVVPQDPETEVVRLPSVESARRVDRPTHLG